MKGKNTILFLACTAIFFEAFDVSILNLSLTAIASDLNLHIATGQWLQTVYLVSFGGFLLLGGRLSDQLGAKRVFLGGMSLFAIASLTAALTNDLELLLVSRAAQGTGAALAMPAAIALLSLHFPDAQERNRALGIFGSFAAFGFGLGLAIGGILIRYLNWHWIFGINIPVFALILFIAYRHLPTDRIEKRLPMNVLTACWLCISLLILCYTIHELPVLGWYGVGGILLGGLSFIGMLQYDKRSTNPFFKPGAVTRKTIKAQIASVLLGACFLSFLFLVTRTLLIDLRLDTRDAGFLLFPFSIISAFVSSYVLPRLFNKLGVSRSAALSLLFMALAFGFLFLAVYFHAMLFVLAALFCMNSFAIAIGYPALTILAVQGVAPAHQGSAAGLQSCLYSIGSSVGVSVTALFMQL